MSWKECSVEKQRRTVVALALAPDANLAQLARNFGISRKTLYKWRARASGHQDDPLGEWAKDRSRKPASSPWRTCAQIEERIAELRRQYSWGARKIHRLLVKEGSLPVPSVSTVSAILGRLGLIEEHESCARGPIVRFEHPEPNQLWQMDFKGHFAVGSGRCYPLTVIDDHSRYALCVRALAGESGELTRPALIEVFRRYGLPDRMIVDNGSCWGRVEGAYTQFTAWLLRLDVKVTHSRPYRPQTRGKNERFNRTLKAEAIEGHYYRTLQDCQRSFDKFQLTYNTLRPHEALGLNPPSSRYRVSARAYPERLPAIEYLEDDVVRRVGQAGYISWGKQRFHVGRAFSGNPVAMRPCGTDGIYEVYFCCQRIAIIDRRDESCRQT